MNERLYIKLTTTERAPYPYRLETTKDTPLVGYVKYIEANQLSNPYKVPDFLEDLYLDGKIKELKRYNNISPYELFVITCPLDEGVELFVGVPSERYPAHLESRLLPGRHYAKFNLRIILLMKLGIILNPAYNLLYLMKKIAYMLKFIL